MKKFFRKVIQLAAPLTISVDWAGDSGTSEPALIARHKAWTRRGALEWVRCYPVDAVVRVRNQVGAVVAARA